MSVTFINLFQVPEDREEEFLRLWREVNTYMRTKPGFVEHRLHRALALPPTPYRFVNVAVWESQQVWQAAHDDGFRALIGRPEWRSFPNSPGLYELAHESHTQGGG